MDETVQEYLSYGLEKAVRRSKRYKCNDAWWDWDHDYRRYDHGREDIKHFYMMLDKFLQKNVGRPYKKVYGEFCAKWPAKICGDVDTRWAFRNKISSSKNYYNDWEFNEYTVNSNGLLIVNPNSYRSKHHKEKYKTIGYTGDSEYHYMFNKAWFKYPDAVDFLYDTIGILNTYTIKDEEYIPKKLVELLLDKNYEWKEFFINHKHYRDCGNWIYEQKVFYNDPVKVKVGSKEYKQYLIESKKNTKAKLRVNKIQHEEYLNSLLHNIEAERKAKLHVTDIIDRDRLGFNNESFKGEFYHGQKRKKKKNESSN